MPDPIDGIYDSNPNNLAELLQIEKSSKGEWGDQEIEQIMKHQIDAPLPDELGRVYPEQTDSIREMAESCDPAIETIGQLLTHPAPPIDLLEKLKEASKAARRDKTSAMPVEVPTAIYFASIGAALVKRDELISNLDAPELQKGLAWTGNQDWVDEDVADIARQAETKL